MHRIVVLYIPALAMALLASRQPTAGDGLFWRPILSEELYAELVKRESDMIRQHLDGNPEDKAIRRAKYGAVLIAAFTLSVKDGLPAEELRRTRRTAFRLAEMLKNRDQLDAAIKLAAVLPKPVSSQRQGRRRYSSRLAEQHPSQGRAQQRRR
jgi:hypothetical protein